MSEVLGGAPTVEPSDAREAVRFVAVSDLHGELPVLPEGDVLLIGGDSLPVADHSRDAQIRFALGPFTDWLYQQRFELIVGIGGNHDFLFQAEPRWPRGLHWRYLQDETVEHRGLKIHGAPWSNRFGEWAFMADEIELEQYWAAIPTRLMCCSFMARRSGRVI